MTPEAMLSYPHLFEPQAVNEGDPPKYSCTLVFAPGTDLSQLKAAAAAVAKDAWGDKAVEVVKKQRYPTFRTDAEEKGYPEGSTFINATSKGKPGVVAAYAGPDGKAARITDPEEIYAGCYVRATVRPFAYDQRGNRGVSFGLVNIQKLRDGERIGGRPRPEDEFEPIAGATPPAPADPPADGGLSDQDPFA